MLWAKSFRVLDGYNGRGEEDMKNPAVLSYSSRQDLYLALKKMLRWEGGREVLAIMAPGA